jgi:hypothetical protein
MYMYMYMYIDDVYACTPISKGNTPCILTKRLGLVYVYVYLCVYIYTYMYIYTQIRQ